MRYKIRFSYDGTDFFGYQKQPNQRTVQGVMEEVLSKLNGEEPVSLVASGRTDAHVHATGQCAHFDLKKDYTEERLRSSLNQMLPKDLYVRELHQVEDTFHARFDVIEKTYCYKINLGEYNPIERNFVYQYGKPLDLVAMEQAIPYLLGTHSFQTFTKADESREDYVRTITKIEIKQYDNLLVLWFTGTGFLRYMVRNLVGTLLEVGSGKRTSKSVKSLLESRDRTKAGITAPPEGLFLENVVYSKK